MKTKKKKWYDFFNVSGVFRCGKPASGCETIVDI